MHSWEQRKLGEVCEIKDSARIPNSEWSESGIPYIRASDVTNENTDGVLFISQERYEFYKNRTGAPTKNDVLFNGGGEIGKSLLITDEKPIYVQGGAVLYARTSKSRELVGQYLKTYFETTNAKSYIDAASAGGTMRHFTLKPSQKMRILMPSVEEQEKIGGYFVNLDRLITLHQRKYDETKTLKKYMLQKMFPQNGEKVPEIRFDGFTEDWEQRKLGDNIVEYTEKTTENNQYPVLTSSRKGIFFQTDYYDGNQIASADNTGYNIVPYGYFTYRHMSDDEIFHFNINDIAENGIVSTLYPVFTTDENLDSRYLQYQLNYGREFARYAILQKQGGSRTYMYLNKLRNLYLTVPTAIEEQKKISEYFTNLDHLITLHQRKCNELKEIKKYMLQNMFV